MFRAFASLAALVAAIVFATAATAYPTRHIYVTQVSRDVYTRGWIAVFPIDARGDVAPEYVLKGPATEVWSPLDVNWDSEGDLYVADDSWQNSHGTEYGCARVLVFGKLKAVNPKPIRRIVGRSHTGFCQEVGGVAVDHAGNIYVAALENNSIEVFGPHQHGDVAPLRSFAVAQNAFYLRMDENDHLFAGGASSNPVTEYDTAGNVLAQFPVPGHLNAFDVRNGLLYLPTQEPNLVTVVRVSDGSTLYAFPYPNRALWSATADERGSIFAFWQLPRPKHLPPEILVYPPGDDKPNHSIAGLSTTLIDYGLARAGP